LLLRSQSVSIFSYAKWQSLYFVIQATEKEIQKQMTKDNRDEFNNQQYVHKFKRNKLVAYKQIIAHFNNYCILYTNIKKNPLYHLAISNTNLKLTRQV